MTSMETEQATAEQAPRERSADHAATQGAHPILDELVEALGAKQVITDADLLESHRRDAAALCESHLPLAAVRPRTESEVQEVVALAAANGVAIVPQGAMTGLAGAANGVENCIAVSTANLNQVIDLDPENMVAVVQPGVTNKQLKEAAAEHGLTYRPDPSSWESSTLGGNIATNAGGLCCVKYGVTSTFVRGLRVVLADGRAVQLGRPTVKHVAGLNLVDLFVGSEGTLGIITEATIGLDFPSSIPMTMAATFETSAQAASAVSAIRAAGVIPSMLELLDKTVLEAISAHANMAFDEHAGALLVAQSDAGGQGERELEKMAELCSDAGAIETIVAEDERESEQLVQARRLAYPAMEALGPTLVDDVCVPLAALPEMVSAVAEVAEGSKLTIGVVGHAGDGNIHPTIVVESENPQSLAEAHRAFEEIAERALRLGGTITGEHGVGLLKRELLEKELDPVAAQLQRGVKELLDPHYLMNPGKVLSAPAVEPTSRRPEKDS